MNIPGIVCIGLGTAVILALIYKMWTLNAIDEIGKDKYKALKLCQKWKLVRHVNKCWSAYVEMKDLREKKYISNSYDNGEYEERYYRKLHRCADLYFLYGNHNIEDISRTEKVSFLDVSEYILMYKSVTAKWRCSAYFPALCRYMLGMLGMAMLLICILFILIGHAGGSLVSEIPGIIFMLCVGSILAALACTREIAAAREDARDCLYLELLNNNKITFNAAIDNLHVSMQEITESLASYKEYAREELQ